MVLVAFLKFFFFLFWERGCLNWLGVLLLVLLLGGFEILHLLAGGAATSTRAAWRAGQMACYGTQTWHCLCSASEPPLASASIVSA
ncbi:hypothetical protein K505DRAFT_134326 [Melanomma pulvis-pyrius CBS 109.77]|uniref:Uncharacterized protein n=1 Tax=Melanomma pulvis-pyrius CBS 109.77 TaxID=1314802 RepID=A0A6A6WSH2_9PLEO|nr:hypothetical protein K505DRAFT_134326 [Melanomma pulvis-pyrius CBS 109.77]